MSEYSRSHPEDPFGNMPWSLREEYEKVAKEIEDVVLSGLERGKSSTTE